MSDTDETLEFRPKFNADGLITAVVSELDTGEPLMVAHMNAEALRLTMETGEAHFFSRSRSEIWHKGGTSGNVLKVEDVRVDCDQDVLWLTAEPLGHGAACHTGRKSCFYRLVTGDPSSPVLEKIDNTPLFDPNEVYSA